MKIAVIADDTCDIPKTLLEENNIYLTNISVILGATEYRGNVSPDMIYDYVAETRDLPQTAALSSVIYKEEFERLLKHNDAVIHFSLSSGISSSYNNACKAAEELENVFVIDTQSLTAGSGILVLEACKKIKEGLAPQQIVEDINRLKDKVQASFLISKLDYLKKGGRCSSAAAFGANLLGLKIMIDVEEGKMKASKKYMGKMNVALKKYVQDLIKEKPPIFEEAFVVMSSNMPEKDDVVAELNAQGFKKVWVVDACSTICCHCGPGTLGVIYLQK